MVSKAPTRYFAIGTRLVPMLSGQNRPSLHWDKTWKETSTQSLPEHQ